MTKRGKLVLRTDRCKGCELCVSACPMKILQLDSVAVNRKGYHPSRKSALAVQAAP